MQTNIDIPSQPSFPTNGRSKGFTLVELIVVVVILGILSTVGFVSYSSYLAGTRDTNRISQLTALHDGLELYRTTKDLPLPDEYVEVKSNGTTIAYQGYAGEGVLETIDFTKGGKDPKDSTYFSYYLTSDKKYFQLMAFLEESDNLLTQTPNSPSSPEYSGSPSPSIEGDRGGAFIPQAHAATDYTNRYPTVNGHKLGILTESGTNAPIQEVTTITNSGYLDIVLTTDSYKANLTDTRSIVGTGVKLPGMRMDGSCKRIKELGKSQGDGIYTINPTGASSFEVYCDMTIEGGGWTKCAEINDEELTSLPTTPSYDDDTFFCNTLVHTEISPRLYKNGVGEITYSSVTDTITESIPTTVNTRVVWTDSNGDFITLKRTSSDPYLACSAYVIASSDFTSSNTCATQTSEYKILFQVHTLDTNAVVVGGNGPVYNKKIFYDVYPFKSAGSISDTTANSDYNGNTAGEKAMLYVR